ncbi:MAG: 3-phosphoshikimate 1-carboxyvinyltransferase [Syntrophaceticus sp.]
MKLLISPGQGLSGRCSVPGDKSISHRAALIASIAEGETQVFNYSMGADCLHTLQCLERLGVVIEKTDRCIRITGRGLDGLKEPRDILNTGNSGTTMRLLLGLLTGQDFFAVLTGDESLCQRPMGRVITPLAMMGAQIWGRSENRYAPLAIRGTSEVRPIEYRLPVPSAQVKSALLLAGLKAPGTTTIIQPLPSRDHTERMLQVFGASLRMMGNVIHLEGNKRLKGQVVQVPGDISAAAFLIVAATLIKDSEILIQNVGINPTRTGILDVLEMMGAEIEIQNLRSWNNEPVADLLVRSAELRGTVIEGELLPRVLDEIPVLAVAAAAAQGETEINDAGELRVKETDRLRAITTELQKMKVEIKEKPEGLWIRGGQLQGARVSSWGDHRIAMALAIAGLAARGETLVDDAECLDISFPTFSELFRGLGAGMAVQN